MSSYDYTFKILLLGDDSDLKTSFTKRYCYNIFNPSERLTIGVDFHVKTIEMNNKKIKLQIWDVGGEERFRFLLPTYCLGANAAFLFYDITRPQTLDNINEWTTIVRQKGGPIPIGLVGMRADKASQRKVPRNYAIDLAQRLGLNFYGEASAKTGQNISKLFEVITELALGRVEITPQPTPRRTYSPYSPKELRYKQILDFVPDIILDAKAIEEINEEINKLLEKYEEWEYFAILKETQWKIPKDLKLTTATSCKIIAKKQSKHFLKQKLRFIRKKYRKLHKKT